MKSIHTHIFVFILSTMTILDTRSGYVTRLMKLIASNMIFSLLALAFLSAAIIFCLCLTSRASIQMSGLWHETLLSILGIRSMDNTKPLLFLISRLTIFSLSFSVSLVETKGSHILNL